MNWMRSISRWLLWTGVVLIGTTGTASAQNAILYEVTETMKLRGRNPEHRSRAATAALAGTIAKGTTLCPAELADALGVPACGVVAIASDNLSLATGKGPVKGSFSVVIQGDNKVDGAELVIARGSLRGRIDLSPAIGSAIPLGTLTASWRAVGEPGGPLGGVTVNGKVAGVFRLPFVFGLPEGCLDDGNPSDCAYVSKPSYLFGDYPNVYPVDLKAGGEYSLGVPTVRLDLNFETTGYWDRDDDNDRHRDRDGDRD